MKYFDCSKNEEICQLFSLKNACKLNEKIRFANFLNAKLVFAKNEV